MDFEIENAKEWQGDTTSQLVQPARMLLPSQPKLVGLPTRNAGTAGLGYRADEQNAVNDWNRYALSHDNAGTTAWRQRRRPDDTYKLPIAYGVIYETLHEASRRKPQPRRPTSPEDGLKQESLQDVLGEIGQSTGAFIELPARSAAQELRIWGNPAGVARAKARLKEFVDKVETQYLEWVKILRTSKRKRKDIQTKMTEEWEKQNFRQNPPGDAFFPFQGHFLWPTHGYPITVLLGSSLEAWDSLRTQHRCYITFDPAKSMVRVFGEQQEHVDLALDGIRVTLREICVRSDPPAKIYLMEPPEAAAVQRSIALVPYKHFNKAAMSLGPQGAPVVVPFMVGPPPSHDDRRDWVTCHPGYGVANQKCIERAIHVILQRVRFFRGHINMRVHFGFFCLGAYKKPGDANHTLEEYHSMLGNGQTMGELIRDLKHDIDLDDIIASSAKATSLLAPKDYNMTSLASVECEYSASFNLHIADSSLACRLEVAFATEGNGKYVVSTCKWFKRGKRSGSPDNKPDLQSAKLPLSIICSDPKRGSAWEINISCRTTLDKSQVSQAMDDFARSIVLNMPKSAAAKETAPSISYRAYSLRVESFTLRTTRCYVLKGSSYILEVAKDRTTLPSLQGVANHVQTRWTANMHSHEWEGIWIRQPYLMIGEHGDWEPKLEDFFRYQGVGGGGGSNADRDGFKEFLDMVKAVSHMLGPDLKGMVDNPATFAVTGAALIEAQAQSKANQAAQGVQSGAKQPEREASQHNRLTHAGHLVKKGKSPVNNQALHNRNNVGYGHPGWKGSNVVPNGQALQSRNNISNKQPGQIGPVVVPNGVAVNKQKIQNRTNTGFGKPGWSGPNTVVANGHTLQNRNPGNGKPGGNHPSNGKPRGNGSNVVPNSVTANGLNLHNSNITSNGEPGPSGTYVMSNGHNMHNHSTANSVQNAMHAVNGPRGPFYRFGLGKLASFSGKHAGAQYSGPVVPKLQTLTDGGPAPSVHVHAGEPVHGNTGAMLTTASMQSHLEALLIGDGRPSVACLQLGGVGHSGKSAGNNSVSRYKLVMKSKASEKGAQQTKNTPPKNGCVEGNLIDL